VPFPFPDAAHRRRIWEGVWPKEVPLAPDVDLEDLAESYKLSGGGIRNVALAAAYLAAEEGVPIARAHLLRAMQREMEKEGKMLKGPDGESP
jgi:SpoVK/Ycf46/Vps4 family AAA+-type ATPase